MREFFMAGADELHEVTKELLFEDPGIAKDVEDIFDLYFNLAYYAFLIPGELADAETTVL